MDTNIYTIEDLKRNKMSVKQLGFYSIIITICDYDNGFCDK